jgi:Zn-finger protein
MDEATWRGKHYAYFQNTACEYFPCHTGADPANFNCLFCYCPQYALGAGCCGHPAFLPGGVKDCSGCLTPHLAENNGKILAGYDALRRLMEQTAPISQPGERGNT